MVADVDSAGVVAAIYTGLADAAGAAVAAGNPLPASSTIRVVLHVVMHFRES